MIQEKIERAIKKILNYKKRFKIDGAGRTDKGVHVFNMQILRLEKK